MFEVQISTKLDIHSLLKKINLKIGVMWVICPLKWVCRFHPKSDQTMMQNVIPLKNWFCSET